MDPSGGSADSFTAGVGHRGDDGLIVLDAVREIRPPFSPEAVTRELASFFLSYGIKQIRSDRYAGAWPKEQFSKYGIDCEQSAAPKSDLDSELLPVINSRSVELLTIRGSFRSWSAWSGACPAAAETLLITGLQDMMTLRTAPRE